MRFQTKLNANGQSFFLKGKNGQSYTFTNKSSQGKKGYADKNKYFNVKSILQMD
jgi:hypothetical protein